VTLLTRAVTATAILFSRASRAFVYLAIGTQRLGTLQDGIRIIWNDFAPAHGDTGGLFPVERELVDRYVPRGGRILTVGSGTGRDLIGLAELGYQMTGVEPAPGAIEQNEQVLREHGLSATLIPGFFEDVAVGGGPYDAVIFSFFCYSYIPMSVRRVQILRKAAGLLSPGGKVLVSYVAAGRPNPRLPRLARLSAAITGSDWRVEEGDAVSMRLDGVPRPCFHLQHVFTTREALDEVAAAGLEVIHHRTAIDYPWIICAVP
jgi:SAM-dependent methyltransferase